MNHRTAVKLSPHFSAKHSKIQSLTHKKMTGHQTGTIKPQCAVKPCWSSYRIWMRIRPSAQKEATNKENRP